LALALIVFGPDKLPDLARQVGKTVADLRRVTADVNAEFQRSLQADPRSPRPPSSPSVRPASDGSGHDDLQPPY
jgi:Sec-independent protein translocase protein TatA